MRRGTGYYFGRPMPAKEFEQKFLSKVLKHGLGLSSADESGEDNKVVSWQNEPNLSSAIDRISEQWKLSESTRLRPTGMIKPWGL